MRMTWHDHAWQEYIHLCTLVHGRFYRRADRYRGSATARAGFERSFHGKNGDKMTDRGRRRSVKATSAHSSTPDIDTFTVQLRFFSSRECCQWAWEGPSPPPLLCSAVWLWDRVCPRPCPVCMVVPSAPEWIRRASAHRTPSQGGWTTTVFADRFLAVPLLYLLRRQVAFTGSLVQAIDSLALHSDNGE